VALSNTQYDTILRDYNQKRLDSRRILEERTREIYDKLPDYKEMDDLIASISVNRAKQRLMGTEAEENNEEIADILEDINTRKKLLLTSAGYSVNYLDPVYTCSYCKDTGYIGDEKCHCFKQAVLDLLYEQSNIRDVLSTENFKNLSFEYQSGEDLVHFKKATQKAEEFVQAFDYDYRNLLFYGTVGTGKSFLSNCVANALLEKGHSVIYFSAAGLFERISEYTFQKGGKDASVNPFDDIYNCDLLIIDDLGTEMPGQFVTAALYSLLNDRILEGKPMVISTNLNVQEMARRYSPQIASRLHGSFTGLTFVGEDIRIKKSKER